MSKFLVNFYKVSLNVKAEEMKMIFTNSDKLNLNILLYILISLNVLVSK